MSSPEQKLPLRHVLDGESVVGKDEWRTTELIWTDDNKKEKNRINKFRNKIFKKLNELRSLQENSIYHSTDYLLCHYDLLHLAAHPLSELQVPAFHHYDKPYWKIPYSAATAGVLTTQVSPNLEIWAGPLSWFPQELRALMVDMAMRVYAAELLKTQRIAADQVQQLHPQWSTARQASQRHKLAQHLDAQLLLAMIHSFRDQYLVALAFAQPDGAAGQKHLVGSIGAVKGQSDQPFGWTRGYDGADQHDHSLLSSLPTNAALYYQLNPIGELLTEFAEDELVEITRLNVASKAYTAQYGVQRSQISSALMYIIHEVVATNFPDVKAEVFNTQPELHRVIRQLGLPAEVIAVPETVRPTQVVSDSIHGQYFQRSPPLPQMMTIEGALAASRQFFHPT